MNNLLSKTIHRAFVDLAQSGKNKSWRFALVFVVVVFAVALANNAWSPALPE